MTYQTHCQNISLPKNNVRAIINNGDTLIQMNLSDAKIILENLLLKEISDSLIDVYITRDSLNNNIIFFKNSQIELLKQQLKNKNIIILNNEKIVSNKDKIIETYKSDAEIKDKEIKKQKRLKTIGFIGSITLPILTIFLIMSH